MEYSRYGLSVTLPVSFDTAVADTTAVLKAEGFRVLTSIDVQQTLTRPYCPFLEQPGHIS